jgi:hypothetical protein
MAKRRVGTTHDLEDPSRTLRFRLRVANQGSAEAPVLGAPTFGEVEQARQLGWFHFNRHSSQPRGRPDIRR